MPETERGFTATDQPEVTTREVLSRSWATVRGTPIPGLHSAYPQIICVMQMWLHNESIFLLLSCGGELLSSLAALCHWATNRRPKEKHKCASAQLASCASREQYNLRREHPVGGREEVCSSVWSWRRGWKHATWPHDGSCYRTTSVHSTLIQGQVTSRW